MGESHPLTENHFQVPVYYASRQTAKAASLKATPQPTPGGHAAPTYAV